MFFMCTQNFAAFEESCCTTVLTLNRYSPYYLSDSQPVIPPRILMILVST
jgi:hypothetical protein